jgi:hypothetical protein
LSASLDQYRMTVQSLIESGYLDPDEVASPAQEKKP